MPSVCKLYITDHLVLTSPTSEHTNSTIIIATMTLENIPFIPSYYKLVFIAEGAANAIYGIHASVPPLLTPQEAYIEEYSETTPPPSIIDIEDEEGDEEAVDESVFDSKCGVFRFYSFGAKFST